MKSLMRLYGFLRPYRIPASISLSLLVAMVAADLLIPRLTQRIIDQASPPATCTWSSPRP
ncbi:ABC transporter ATP-binding protein [Desulfosarcina cetonica]|uniref:ABC transporter ATP-binding protein n=1 Tax=Desulfosarcina cetonica TaxID=90730 RepID=UPI0006CF929D|nr:ABC transporter ATP-binding protein [Desulfosarcina cetonica]